MQEEILVSDWSKIQNIQKTDVLVIVGVVEWRDGAG